MFIIVPVLCIAFAVVFLLIRQKSEKFAIIDIQAEGNLVLSASATEFLEKGYNYGDLVTVNIAGTSYEMPVGANYSDVKEGEMLLRMDIEPEKGDDSVKIAVNSGEAAAYTGLAFKNIIAESPGYRWSYKSNVEMPITVTITKKTQSSTSQ